MPGIGATGSVGVAFEATANTYVAPTKWLSVLNEGLAFDQGTVWRRVLRGTADVNNATAGNVHVNGDVEIEATPDSMIYLLYASRAGIVKTGTGPYTYNVTGTHGATATAARTLSFTVVRHGVVFAYVGCVVGSYRLAIADGGLTMSASIIGSDEATQAVPTVVYPTALPFGAGMYNIQIPTATQVFDMDTFTFEVNDNAEPQFRLKNTGRGAQFIKFGERDTTITCERDFETKTEYNAFKALTAQSITLKATQSANADLTILMPASIHENYAISGLSGQGDLIRASITYRGVHDNTTTASYKLTVITTENIT